MESGDVFQVRGGMRTVDFKVSWKIQYAPRSPVTDSSQVVEVDPSPYCVSRDPAFMTVYLLICLPFQIVASDTVRKRCFLLHSLKPDNRRSSILKVNLWIARLRSKG